MRILWLGLADRAPRRPNDLVVPREAHEGRGDQGPDRTLRGIAAGLRILDTEPFNDTETT